VATAGKIDGLSLPGQSTKSSRLRGAPRVAPGGRSSEPIRVGLSLNGPAVLKVSMAMRARAHPDRRSTCQEGFRPDELQNGRAVIGTFLAHAHFRQVLVRNGPRRLRASLDYGNTFADAASSCSLTPNLGSCRVVERDVKGSVPALLTSTCNQLVGSCDHSFVCYGVGGAVKANQ
jgi:hypothetical protein